MSMITYREITASIDNVIYPSSSPAYREGVMSLVGPRCNKSPGLSPAAGQMYIRKDPFLQKTARAEENVRIALGYLALEEVPRVSCDVGCTGDEPIRVRAACPLERRRDARSYPSALFRRDASWRCAVELLNSNDLFPPRLRLSFKSAFRVVDSQRLCRSLRSKPSRLRHVPT